MSSHTHLSVKNNHEKKKLDLLSHGTMGTEGVLLNTSLPTVTFEQVCGGSCRRAVAEGQAEEQHATETDYIKVTFRFRRLARSLIRRCV